MNAASLTEGIVWDFQTHPEYMELVRSRGTVLNFACYVGHSSLRLYVMGDAAYERAATAEETGQMCRLVVEAIEAGAAGFSTSFAYTHRGMDGLPVPSRFAEREEVEALFMAAGSTGKGVVLATAGEQCTYADMYELQPRIGRPFTYPVVRAGRAAATSPSSTCMTRPSAGAPRSGPRSRPGPSPCSSPWTVPSVSM